MSDLSEESKRKLKERYESRPATDEEDKNPAWLADEADRHTHTLGGKLEALASGDPERVEAAGHDMANPGDAPELLSDRETAKANAIRANMFSGQQQPGPQQPQPQPGAQPDISQMAPPPAPVGPQDVALPSGGGGAFHQDESEEAAKRRLGIIPKSDQQQRVGLEQANLAAASTDDLRKSAEESERARREQEAINQAAEFQKRQWEAERIQRTDEALKQREARLADLEKSSKLDPDHFWNNHWAGPVGSRVLGGIAMGLSSLGGTGDQTYKMIKDSVNNDIEAQKAKFEAKRDLYKKAGELDSDKLQSIQDRINGLEHIRIAGYNAAADRLKGIAAASGDQEKIAKAAQAETLLRKDAADADQKDAARVVQNVQQTMEENLRRQASANAAAASQARADAKWNAERHDRFDLANMSMEGKLSAVGNRADARDTREIAKADAAGAPAYKALDSIIRQIPDIQKFSKTERFAMGQVMGPTEPGWKTGLADLVLGPQAKEMASNVRSYRAFAATADGGKTVTEVETRLGMPKGHIDQLMDALIHGEATPKQIQQLQAASDLMKQVILERGSAGAQDQFLRQRATAESNVSKLK